MRVAIYARKSQENEDAITRQIILAREFADRSGFVVVQDFQDDGISGAEFVDRPGLTALVAAAKAHAFEGVITMNVDRFGREAFRTNLVMLEIVEAGVRIFTYQDGQEVKLDTPIAKQMISMRNYAAEDFNANISAKTQAALILKARAGQVTGTRTYGYDHTRVGLGKGSHAERSVNAIEREVILRVFTLASQGLGNRRIVDTLVADHVQAPGKGWSKSVVKTMLTNRLYIGEVVFGRSKPAVSGGRAKRRAIIKDESRWTVVQQPALRIIPDALWSKVQDRRAASLARYNPHRSTDGKLTGRPEAGLIAQHLLNGFLVCGVCDGSLTFLSKNGRTKSYYCSRRNSQGIHACSNNRGVPEPKLDAAVLESLHAVIEDPDVLWTLLTERTARWREEQSVSVDERKNLVREEQRLESAIEKLLDQIENGAAVSNRLKTRQAELDALRVRLAEPEPLDLEQADFERSLAKNAEWLRWRGPVIKANDTAQTRAAMRTLGIGRIVVTPTESGWTFAGDGNLSGLVNGAHRESRPSPRFPPVARRSNSGRHSFARHHLLEIARSRAPRPARYARRFLAKKSVQRVQASAAAAAL